MLVHEFMFCSNVSISIKKCTLNRKSFTNALKMLLIYQELYSYFNHRESYYSAEVTPKFNIFYDYTLRDLSTFIFDQHLTRCYLFKKKENMKKLLPHIYFVNVTYKKNVTASNLKTKINIPQH